MSSLSAVEAGRGGAEEPPPGAPAGAEPGRRVVDRAQHRRRRCRRRAGARGRPPARPTRGRGARARAAPAPASRRPWGGPPSSRRGAGPGRVSSLVRAPPPIVSAASITVTATPRVARVAAQASPLGPAPTTIASLMRAAVATLPAVRTGNGRPVEPGLARDHVGDVDRALLDQAVGGVEDPVALALHVGAAGTRA